jgi:hypothetical protein
MDQFKEMINALWLTDEIHWDLALYGLFLLNLILLIMQTEGSALATGLLIIVLVSLIIDKTRAFGYMIEFDMTRYTREQFHEQIFIGTYLIRVAMFAVPLSIAGMTKNEKSRGPAVVAGIAGGAYMFTRWFFEQRDVAGSDVGIGYIPAAMMMQHIGLLLMLVRITLRNSLRTVYRDVPVTVTGELAAHDVEIKLP